MIMVTDRVEENVSLPYLLTLTKCDSNSIPSVTAGSRVHVFCEKPVKGQYVFVYTTSGFALTICEVEILTAGKSFQIYNAVS